MEWLAGLYVNCLNLIQYMHDKYYYEAAELALIDTDVRRTFATGIAGFSHVVDSLSAIKYAKVKTIRDEDGIAVDYEIDGDFPKYGNDDDRAELYGFSIHSLRKLRSTTHTEMLNLQHQSLQLHLMLYMVRLQVLFLTDVKQANRFHQVQTHLTVQSRTDFLLLLTQLQSFRIHGLLTVFQIHRLSALTHWVIQNLNRFLIWLMLWTDTLIRVHITLMLMYLVQKSLSTLWNIRRRKSMQTLQSVFPVMLLSLLILHVNSSLMLSQELAIKQCNFNTDNVYNKNASPDKGRGISFKRR